MNTKGTTEPVVKFDLTKEIDGLKAARRRMSTKDAKEKNQSAYIRAVGHSSRTVYQSGYPIVAEDQQVLTGKTVSDLDGAMSAFVSDIRAKGITVELQHLLLERRKIELADQYHALEYAKEDRRPPCILATFFENNVISDTALDSFLATPSRGWKITVTFGKSRREFTMYATVGFPFADQVKQSVLKDVLRIKDEQRQYQALPRVVVFFTEGYIGQQYALSMQGVSNWLREWVREITRQFRT